MPRRSPTKKELATLPPCLHCMGDIPKHKWRRSIPPKYCSDRCRILGQRERRHAGEIRSFASGASVWIDPTSLRKHKSEWVFPD